MTLPMVYNILVLQQRRVAAACSEPFAAQRRCWAWRGWRSGPDANVGLWGLTAFTLLRSTGISECAILPFFGLSPAPPQIFELLGSMLKREMGDLNHFSGGTSGGVEDGTAAEYRNGTKHFSKPVSIILSWNWAYYNHKKPRLKEVFEVTECNSCCHKCSLSEFVFLQLFLLQKLPLLWGLSLLFTPNTSCITSNF